jgi:hypothetical protein
MGAMSTPMFWAVPRRLPGTALALRVTVLGCVGALASGCAAPGADLPAAGNQFDGTYQGTNSVVRGGGFVCDPVSYPDSITVSGGHFDYRFIDSLAKPAPVPVRIAADGTFSGQLQYGAEDLTPRGRFLTVWVTVTGRIDGTALEATAADYRCTRQLLLQKR